MSAEAVPVTPDETTLTVAGSAEPRKWFTDAIMRDRYLVRALRHQRDTVLALHAKGTVTIYLDRDCADSCDHDNRGEECPLVAAECCTHCHKLGDSQSEWETYISPAVMWPCATVSALTDTADA